MDHELRISVLPRSVLEIPLSIPTESESQVSNTSTDSHEYWCPRATDLYCLVLLKRLLFSFVFLKKRDLSLNHSNRALIFMATSYYSSSQF